MAGTQLQIQKIFNILLSWK